jgi:hypothetical protein
MLGFLLKGLEDESLDVAKVSRKAFVTIAKSKKGVEYIFEKSEVLKSLNGKLLKMR